MISLSVHHFKVFGLYRSNAIRCIRITVFVMMEQLTLHCYKADQRLLHTHEGVEE